MADHANTSSRPGVLKIIGPGLIVAATGVGAGDLATGAFAGSKLGMAVLWAVVLGAFLKFVLNEGLTRWQLATGQTLLEGAVTRLGRVVQAIFLAYLLLWSFFIGMALMLAVGVATQAIAPLGDSGNGASVYAIAASILAVILVRVGGFKLFEKLMSAAIVIMFVTVLTTAVLLRPDLGAFFRGLVVPAIPDPEGKGEGIAWTVALMGGVGGTLTVLCYGYWIREKGRHGIEALKTCRIDLAVGYTATALFGLAMVVIGSTIETQGTGAGLIVKLAGQLERPLGQPGRWAFLIGAWAALFSSLLGVWQAVPYIFADFWGLVRRSRRGAQVTEDQMVEVDTKSTPYRAYLAALAITPMFGLLAKEEVDFSQIQKVYAIVGACFMPMLALVLLILNGRADWVGKAHRNKPLTVVVLVFTLVFFGWIGAREIYQTVMPEAPAKAMSRR